MDVTEKSLFINSLLISFLNMFVQLLLRVFGRERMGSLFVLQLFGDGTLSVNLHFMVSSG